MSISTVRTPTPGLADTVSFYERLGYRAIVPAEAASESTVGAIFTDGSAVIEVDVER